MLERLRQGKAKIAVVGIGYVGLPLVVAFAKKFKVIGFDLDEYKLAAYRKGNDLMGELVDLSEVNGKIDFTSQAAKLKDAEFIIVTVPTPINGDKTPDLTPLRHATMSIGENLQSGAIIVYESTVYPGVTEDICLPILEEKSGLKAGVDFKVGYSPERINPGDTVHRLENIVKIVSGMDEVALREIASVYSEVIEQIHLAPTIKVAEAAKVAENAQRDINIAFMNELAMVFNRMDIDTAEVIKAMKTKWNALDFTPGLVGGHCIGVDPYYFIYEAKNNGYRSQIISAGRRINDGMSEYIAQKVISELVKNRADFANLKIYLMGMTFKENLSDIRNSRSVVVYQELAKYNFDVCAVDPQADEPLFQEEYGIKLAPFEEVGDADVLVFLVGHDEFTNLSWADINKMFKPGGARLIIDVKGIFSKSEAGTHGYHYWSL